MTAEPLESKMKMTKEVELKLSILAQDIDRLKRHPAIKSAQIEKSKTRLLLSTYFDTPQLTLLNSNITLRVRRSSGIWFQTLKSIDSTSTGLHQRREYEHIITSRHPDFSKITDPILVKIFDDKLLRSTLRPIFITKVRRTDWQLGFDNGDKIELALDLGELIVGKRREPISEIELELKNGNTGRLFEFALNLIQSIPLSLQHISKSQRGYDYYRPRMPVIIHANPPHLQRNMSAHLALKQIVWDCFTQLQGNQDVVLYDDNEEGVHQMRVAIRRFRSSLNTFGRIINPQSCSNIIKDLKWIATVLGQARDLDVFTKQTLPSVIQQFPDQPSLIQLQEKAQQAMGVAQNNVCKAIGSQRYQHMLLCIGDWLENERWRKTNSVEYSVLEIAQTVLTKRHKQLKQKSKHLPKANQEERHAARIASKKLRYASEFFAHLYPQNRLKKFMPALIELLDTLGALNDISVAKNLTHKLIGNRPNLVLFNSLYVIADWNACNTIHQLQNLKRNWKRFDRLKPRWS